MKHNTMQQKFIFKKYGEFIGQITIKHNIQTDEYWGSLMKINLGAMYNQINHNHKHTEIKDDEDAIKRVVYNLNHEYLHLAQTNSGHHNSKEQEKHIYAMIGNGGNEWFNEFYDIAQNPAIDSMTKKEA